MKRMIFGLVLLSMLFGCGSEPVKLNPGEVCDDKLKGEDYEEVYSRKQRYEQVALEIY